MTAREVLKILRKDGWYKINQEGSHIQLKHPSKPRESHGFPAPR